MLMVGPIQALQNTGNTIVYNFSSLNESYPKLALFPPNNLGAMNEYDFDMRYAQYILSNEIVFFDMMRIIYALYEGKDVFLLVDTDERMEMYTESLLKFIQQRYGYNATFINSIDDFLNAESGSFNRLGLYNIMQDNNRLSYIAESERIRKGGKPYFEV